MKFSSTVQVLLVETTQSKKLNPDTGKPYEQCAARCILLGDNGKDVVTVGRLRVGMAPAPTLPFKNSPRLPTPRQCQRATLHPSLAPEAASPVKLMVWTFASSPAAPIRSVAAPPAPQQRLTPAATLQKLRQSRRQHVAATGALFPLRLQPLCAMRLVFSSRRLL